MRTNTIMNYINSLMKLNNFTRCEAIGIILEEGRGSVAERISLLLENRDIEPWDITISQISCIARRLGESPNDIEGALKEMSNY